MNGKTIDVLRTHYPNVKWLKSIISDLRIKRYGRYLISPGEVKEGECGAGQRKNIVNKKLRNHRYYAKIDNEIRNILSRYYMERKDQEELRYDMLFCYMAYGFTPDEYMVFGFENRSIYERKKFVSDFDHAFYGYKMNDISQMQIFNNKARTYRYFSKYYKRDAVHIAGKRDFPKFLEFVEKHPVFVKKLLFESFGKGVELRNVQNQTVESVFESLIEEGECLIEELVRQNGQMSRLNESSVNTVRCISFHTGHGVCTPFWFLKAGRKGSFVDNGAAGGILAGIDKDSGICNSDGFDEYKNIYKTHPDSGVQFHGLQIPDWEKLNELCVELSSMVPLVRMIGWDMAYTDSGWVVIEGNGTTQLIVPQIVWQRGIKEEVEQYFQDMMKWG